MVVPPRNAPHQAELYDLMMMLMLGGGNAPSTSSRPSGRRRLPYGPDRRQHPAQRHRSDAALKQTQLAERPHLNVESIERDSYRLDLFSASPPQVANEASGFGTWFGTDLAREALSPCRTALMPALSSSVLITSKCSHISSWRGRLRLERRLASVWGTERSRHIADECGFSVLAGLRPRLGSYFSGVGWIGGPAMSKDEVTSGPWDPRLTGA